jgi:flagellar protein FliO/FliZ
MDASNYLRLIVALGFVLALIGLFALLLRRYGPAAGLAVRRKGGRRLSIVEVMALDARRRLVLVRRDDVEHLLLLGPEDDRVVETHIIPFDARADAGTNAGGAGDFKAVLSRQDSTDASA